MIKSSGFEKSFGSLGLGIEVLEMAIILVQTFIQKEFPLVSVDPFLFPASP